MIFPHIKHKVCGRIFFIDSVIGICILKVIFITSEDIMPKKEIGTIIRDERIAQGMSQLDLVYAASLRSTSTLSELERGERMPRFDTVQTILDALGIDVNGKRVQ